MRRLFSRLAKAAAMALAITLPAGADITGRAPATPTGVLASSLDLSDYVGLRTSSEIIRLDTGRSAGELRNATELDAHARGTFLDVRPFRNSFLITGGVLSGEEALPQPERAAGPAALEDLNATPRTAGRVQLGVAGEGVAPFLGVGYDTQLRADRAWGLKIVAGAIFSGTPEVSMTSRGGAPGDHAIFEADLERGRRDAGKGEVHPVVQLGLTYRF